MVRVSQRFRDLLRKRCEEIIECGFNCFPKWVDSRMPAFKKGERYQRFLTTPIQEDDDFKKLILKRFDDPKVGGLVVVGRVGGLCPIDCDAPKVVNMEDRIMKLWRELKHMVYIDRRVVERNGGVELKGLHVILMIDKEVFLNNKIRIRHQYPAEFSIHDKQPLTISPSLRLERENGRKVFSAYLRISLADLPADIVYDENLDILKTVVEILGGRLEILPIDYSNAEAGEYSGEPGTPYHGLSFREINADNVFLFLKNFARIIQCPGLERLIDSLESGEPMPIHYFIYQDVVPDCKHPRSSWTIVENIVGRILAEAGVDDSAFDKIEEAFRKSEEEYMKAMGKVDHKTLRNNLSRARHFKEFGHDKCGACIFHITGLCDVEECPTRVIDKLKILAARDAIEKAVALTKAGVLYEVG